MMRTVAVTGSADSVSGWVGGRQGARWAQRTIEGALPRPAPRRQAAAPPPPDPAETLRGLTRLREQGILSDAELALMRSRLRV
jgi:hypothetical protein